MIEVLMWGKVIITIAFFIVTAMLGGSFIYMGFKCLNLKADFRDMMGSFVAFLVFVCFGLIILLLPTVALLDQMKWTSAAQGSSVSQVSQVCECQGSK